MQRKSTTQYQLGEKDTLSHSTAAQLIQLLQKEHLAMPAKARELATSQEREGHEATPRRVKEDALQLCL